MRKLSIAVGGVILLILMAPWSAGAQDANQNARTMRPVIRGRHYAVSSMKAEATWAAVKILEAGGNAFDAIVAGQAVLGIADAGANGRSSKRTAA